LTDIRTLLFANALVFAVLATAMILVWRGKSARLKADLAREAAEKRRYEKALKELVQVAAHELRSPLTSIYGTLQLLAGRSEELSEADRTRLLDMARRNSERMVHLLNDLLDLERVESGGASFIIESVDLDRQLVQAQELSEGQASRREVRIELAPLPHARVRADPQRLQQVLSNLLSNALKFSPPGESVRLSAFQRDGMVRVEVSDHGPGIPKELRARVFQRFIRGKAPRSAGEQEKGSGLGLAISKALIEKMGGRIGFEPAEPTGTTFYIELPADGG